MKKLLLCSLFSALACFTYAQYDITGNIQRLSGQPVPEVVVYLGGDIEDYTLSNDSGDYAFTDLPAGSNLSVLPFKDDNPTECVSVRDLIVIGKHIQIIDPLLALPNLIAADVDNSQDITITDMTAIRRVILGRDASFPNNTSWRFMNPPIDPPNFVEEVQVTNLQSDRVVDFIGIKIGDPTDCEGDAPGAPFLTLSASSVEGEPGELVTVDIIANGFVDVSGLQFSVEWDDAVLELEQVYSVPLSGLMPQDYYANGNRLSVCWLSNSLVGEEQPDNAPIITMEFTVVGQAGDVTPIAFTENPTPFEVVDGNCLPYGLNTNDGMVTVTPPASLFAKIYGDTAHNTPTKIKSFPESDGVYVAGTRLQGGVRYATFSKFNRNTGELEWDFQLNEGSIFHDFELVKDTRECLLIGATEPFQVNGVAQDNESILVKVDDSGQLVFGRKYQQTGREHFNRIIRHPDPPQEDAPYFIVGTINPDANPPAYPPPPSATDRVFVMNIDADGGVIWANQYDYGGTAVPDDEFHRGLFAVNFFDGGTPNNGDIVLTGNDSPTNDGIVVEIDGEAGGVVQAYKFETGYDIYDGMEAPGGNIALVGSDFANSQAFFSFLTPLFDNITGLRFEEVALFREVGIDFRSRFYAVGPTNFGSSEDNFNYIHRISFGALGAQLDYARFLPGEATQFNGPRLMVSFYFDRIFYTDGRLNPAGGFGNQDILVGNFDLDLSSPCRMDAPPAVSSFALQKSPIDVTVAPHTLPPPTPLTSMPLNYECEDFCTTIPCEIAFTWSPQQCGEVQFNPVPSGNVPIVSYSWDANCDGTVESVASNPLLQFDQCGATLRVCLTVKYGDGRTCSYEEVVSTSGDVTPPAIPDIQDIIVIGSPDGNGNCTAEVTFPFFISVDDCSRFGAWINDYNNSGDASDTYPQGTTTVNFITFDDCGNEASFQVDVTVVCRNCGEAVVSCFPGFMNNNADSSVDLTSSVLGIVDVRNLDAYNPGDYAMDLSGGNIYHPDVDGPNSWNFTNLGLVFGLAIDNQNNIYAASSTIYGCAFLNDTQSAFGPSGNSRIYRIDAFDAISTLAEQGGFTPGGTTIPSDGAGYGNICYDHDHHQLFATNFHDGFIYRIDLNSNTVVDFFDPFSGPNPISDNDPNFVALGQRPWGIAYNKLDGKLYYSRWTEDRGRRNPDEKNEIWCMPIDETTGGFAGPEALAIELPDHIDTYNQANFQGYSNPVSDIAFSEGGIMLLAERSMRKDCGDATQVPPNDYFRWYSHQSRVLEYQFNGLAWELTPGHGALPFSDYSDDLKYNLGSTGHESRGATTAGGVDYGYASFDPAIIGPSDCDQMMWASGDCLYCIGSCSNAVYGIQGTPTAALDGDACESILIDFDGDPGYGNKVQQGDVEIFKCLSCPPSDTCLISFTWQPADCNTAQFTPQPVGIILVNTYSWDVNCDGVPESTEAEPVLTLGECGAALPVCLTVEYLDGRTCSYEEMVSIPAESMPPVINCSGTYDYSTDPGACYYTGGFGLAISDNCDPAPEIFSYSLTGDTQGSGMGLPPQVNEGVTYVTATAIDNCGNESLPCTFRVTVVDEEAPQIQCPGTVVEQVPGCSDGANVSYPDATAIDNCQLDGITYDISSGSFFSCDQTVVTATATDIFGNSSQCSFSVVVNGCRDCASICGATLDCGAASGQYLFDICVDNLTTLPDGSAVVGVSSQDGVVSVLDGELPGISGAIEVAPPLPAELTFVLSFEFPCPFGVITCVDSITVATPCCEEITVDGLAVCAEEEMISIPLQGDLPFLTGVDYIKWYVAPAPCESFVLAYQAPGIADLPFFPALYSEFDSACVYAEVAFLPGRPCSRLVSDIATIYICQPGAGSLENANGPYCSDALPAVFEPITFSSDEHPACAYTIQWYQDGEAAPGATSDTYVPTGLSFTGGPMDCSSEHLITAEVTNLCGATGHNTTITIYNSEAPTGELFLDPDEAMPFCPGEDATLRYDPKCVGPDPSNWRWCVRTADTDYQPIEGAGATNATWNTNPLDEDTWYSIKKKNGACPEDTISLMIDVREELSITGFSAMEDDDCYPGQVDMAMAFTPLPGPDCEIFVFWYKDGLLLGTTNPATSPATFTHSGPVLAGNYYAVAEDVCCDSTAGSEVVYIGPPMEVGLIAPCFRCNDETIILEGFVENPPEGAVCTYQWLKDGVLIPNANDEILVLYEANATFTFRATCSDCTKEVSYFLLQCGNPVNTRVQPKPGLAIRAVPNPTSGQLSLRVDGSLLPGAHYRLIGQWGRSLQSGELLPGREEYALSLERLPAGLYFIQVFEGDRLVWVEKVVLQE